MEEIDVNEFAKKYGYHPVYMITQFSKLKGISPTKLIIQKKMTLARQLLNDTDMTLKILRVLSAIMMCHILAGHLRSTKVSAQVHIGKN